MFKYFLYTLCVCTRCLCVCAVYSTVSVAMQYGFGRGGGQRLPEDILTFIALAIIR